MRRVLKRVNASFLPWTTRPKETSYGMKCSFCWLGLVDWQVSNDCLNLQLFLASIHILRLGVGSSLFLNGQHVCLSGILFAGMWDSWPCGMYRWHVHHLISDAHEWMDEWNLKWFEGFLSMWKLIEKVIHQQGLLSLVFLFLRFP